MEEEYYLSHHLTSGAYMEKLISVSFLYAEEWEVSFFKAANLKMLWIYYSVGNLSLSTVLLSQS